MTNNATPKWATFEAAFKSSVVYANPFDDVDLRVTFTSPSGKMLVRDGFWDGDDIWQVRFSPDEVGYWNYTTQCSDPANTGLHNQSDRLICTQPDGTTPFRTHGPVQLSANRRHLIHADGTPFFWLADTAWNGPLWSLDDDWEYYLNQRVQQKFTAVQWVTTQWLAAPNGNIHNKLAYTDDGVFLNPAFFQQLDNRHKQINQYGLLSAPVLLWTAGWSSHQNNLLSPGFTLSDDRAIRLARYMVARWGADAVLWILAGDGDYRGDQSGRWKHIGHSVFADRPHAPVALHPQGLQWNMDNFRDEEWLDIAGYQSCHFDNTNAYEWLVEGPPATDWRRIPTRPIINLEPNYENIGALDTKRRFTDFDVRRAMYRSLLVAPTAGASYGAHGVWDWSDGSGPARGHEIFNTPRPWREGLQFAGAKQMAHMHKFFNSFEWWRLIPAPDLISVQPIPDDKSLFATAARTESGDLAVFYFPSAHNGVELNIYKLAKGFQMDWFNVKAGELFPVTVENREASRLKLTTPGDGDWILWSHI